LRDRLFKFFFVEFDSFHGPQISPSPFFFHPVFFPVSVSLLFFLPVPRDLPLNGPLFFLCLGPPCHFMRFHRQSFRFPFQTVSTLFVKVGVFPPPAVSPSIVYVTAADNCFSLSFHHPLPHAFCFRPWFFPMRPLHDPW